MPAIIGAVVSFFQSLDLVGMLASSVVSGIVGYLFKKLVHKSR